ncbi:MFS transporter [Deinococcus maricopensis]|uniref:Major facilitator superfamily MFS_1 n=1 Tax=Deinococcus maricopensis (strain DSM 21211 / LMG 22137 / NRRL B-23946 / LB-34) TaxID=709986 RepID=E8U6E8_DEIML|nr:MFS transporter [Deinococcus maricopensis]ADV66637.1 major facilitator superfamily MFS_1 [Deinococcus maricopensis DSM 21211]
MTTHPLLWNRHFTLWWLGNAQSALGGALAGIALSFLVLHETGSSGAMGVNLALTLLPTLLSPLAGALVDRLPVRLPLIVLNVVRGGAQLLLGLAALHGPVGVPALHALALLNGLIAAFYVPASMGVTPRLVAPQHRARAASLMQGSAQIMQLAGLLGGGLLVSALGSGPSLMFDGMTFLLMAALLRAVQVPDPRARGARSSVRADLQAGVQYTRSSAALLLLPGLALIINAVLAPMEMLLPARMTALGVGAGGFGLFLGLFTGGMASSSLLLAALGARVPARLGGVLGFALSGGMFALLSVTRTAPQMYALAFACGAAIALLNISLSLTFQTLVHPEYYGRVGSLLNTAGQIGMPVTLLLLAPIADRVPLALIFSVTAAVLLLAAALWHAVMRRTPDAVITPATVRAVDARAA